MSTWAACEGCRFEMTASDCSFTRFAATFNACFEAADTFLRDFFFLGFVKLVDLGSLNRKSKEGSSLRWAAVLFEGGVVGVEAS